MNENRTCRKCEREFIQGHKFRYKDHHHIEPKRFYGLDGWCLILCRDCHNGLEKLIHPTVKMPKQWYWELVFKFMGTNHVHVVDWYSRNDFQPIKAIVWKRDETHREIQLVDFASVSSYFPKEVDYAR